jgi:hypothetical protein
MAKLSPIMTMFREFEAKYEQAGDMSIEQNVVDVLLDECSALEKRILALPASSAQDFAAKLIVNTRYGDFISGEIGTGGLLDEAVAILAQENPDAKLVELGWQFEAAKTKARKLDPARNASFDAYETAKRAAGIPDLPRDQCSEQKALERKIYRDTGYKDASEAFNAAHGECIRLMKAIHRTNATTLEGFAVKAAAVAFDQADFEVDVPVPSDVAERMLYRLARDMAKVVKAGGHANG